MARHQPEEQEPAQSEPINNDPPQYPPPPPPAASGHRRAPYPPSAANGTPPSFVPLSPQTYEARPTVGASSPYPANVGKPWSTGLFDCDLNQNNAIMTAFFPCVTFGQIAEILDEGGTSCVLGSFMYILMVPALFTCWIIGSNYRKKLRSKYNLVQAPSEDWTVHLFCPFCALCQEYRELQRRGIDPSLGWMGYQAQQQATMTVPPVNQFMSQ